MSQRVAPHDLDAERAVLGSVIIDALECWPVAGSVLREEHFYAPAHAAIWAAVAVCARASEGLDETMIRGELERAGNLSLADDALTDVTNRVPDTRNIEAHAEVVRNLSVARAVASKASEIANRAYSGRIGDIENYLDEAEHAIGQACGDRSVAGELHSMHEVVTSTFEGIVARADAGGGLMGPPSGFDDLDAYLQGMQGGLTYVIAGRPGMGKTGFALNLVRNVVDHARKPGLFFSLEMTKEQLGQRALASEALVDGMKLRLAAIARDDWPSLTSASGVLSGLPIYVDDQTDDIDGICRLARRAKRQHGGLSIIAVDYLQLCRVSGKHDNREQEVSYVSRTLKRLAKELDVPVVELAQLNRAVEARKDHRPLIGDLRESGAIEQDADAIIFLYRDEIYNRETSDRGLCELVLAKWRFGSTGIVKVVFRKEFTRFENYIGGHDDEDAPYDPTSERYS